MLSIPARILLGDYKEARGIKILKLIYSEKATKFCEIFPLLLTTVHTVKSKGKISQNFVAFSEYMNFNIALLNFAERPQNFANFAYF